MFLNQINKLRIRRVHFHSKVVIYHFEKKRQTVFIHWLQSEIVMMNAFIEIKSFNKISTKKKKKKKDEEDVDDDDKVSG